MASVNNAGIAGPLGMGTAPVTLGSGGSGGHLSLYRQGDDHEPRLHFGRGAAESFPSRPASALSGVIGGNGSFTKTGSGTLTLSGSNLYTGATNIASGTLAVAARGRSDSTSGVVVSQGSLQVTAGQVRRDCPASGNVTLSGGNLGYVGNGSVNPGQVAGGLVLNPGQNTVTTATSPSSACYLQFASGSTSHTTGATVNFVPTSSYIQFQADAPRCPDGIIGGYAYYNGTDFAHLEHLWALRLSHGRGHDLHDFRPGAGIRLRDARTSGPCRRFRDGLGKDLNSLNLTGSYGVTISGGGSVSLNSGGLIGTPRGRSPAGRSRGRPTAN